MKIIDKARCCGKVGGFMVLRDKDLLEKKRQNQNPETVFVREQEHLIENEVAVLRRVRHPSIIQLIEVDETPTQLFLVMELVKVHLLPFFSFPFLFSYTSSCLCLLQGGDLFDAITSSTKYSERDASAMVFNLAGAIKYLHRMNIVHRDIKPENLLVRTHAATLNIHSTTNIEEILRSRKFVCVLMAEYFTAQ